MMASDDISLNCSPPSLFLFTADILEDMIHLLEGPAPSFWNEEISPNKRQQAEDGEEGISPETSVLYQWRRYQTLLVNIRPFGL